MSTSGWRVALLEIQLHQHAGEPDDAADAVSSASKPTLESIATAVAERSASLLC